MWCLCLYWLSQPQETKNISNENYFENLEELWSDVYSCIVRIANTIGPTSQKGRKYFWKLRNSFKICDFIWSGGYSCIAPANLKWPQTCFSLFKKQIILKIKILFEVASIPVLAQPAPGDQKRARALSLPLSNKSLLQIQICQITILFWTESNKVDCFQYQTKSLLTN